MLQQTRVETVIPYYEAFMSKYPAVDDLAAADFEDVAKLWQGLGYYSRARNLHRAAKVVMTEFGGAIPSSEAEIRSLPGIGPYTAGAVLSIAFDEPVPAVDGNVLRVMARFLGIEAPIETSAVKQEITAKVEQWLHLGKPSILTQALMELGATVCTPRAPECPRCPVQGNCVAFKNGSQSRLPVRKPKQAKRCVDVYALWYERNGHVLMHRRSEEGLLAGMWELPAVEYPGNPRSSGKLQVRTTENEEKLPVEVESKLMTLFEQVRDSEVVDHRSFTVRELGANSPQSPEYSVLLQTGSDRGDVSKGAESSLYAFARIAEERHLFTHIDWRVQVLRPVGLEDMGAERAKKTTSMRGLPTSPDPWKIESKQVYAMGQQFRWVPVEKIENLVLPRVYEKLLSRILGNS